MMVEPPQALNCGKIWQQLDWYFRFDSDDKTSCKYILSITSTWRDQFNTYMLKQDQKCRFHLSK